MGLFCQPRSLVGVLRSNSVYFNEALSWIDARMVLGAYAGHLKYFRLCTSFANCHCIFDTVKDL